MSLMQAGNEVGNETSWHTTGLAILTIDRICPLRLCKCDRKLVERMQLCSSVMCLSSNLNLSTPSLSSQGLYGCQVPGPCKERNHIKHEEMFDIDKAMARPVTVCAILSSKQLP